MDGRSSRASCQELLTEVSKWNWKASSDPSHIFEWRLEKPVHLAAYSILAVNSNEFFLHLSVFVQTYCPFHIILGVQN
jgi:hypothetical protein